MKMSEILAVMKIFFFFFLITEMFSQLPSTGHRFPALLSRKTAFCITESIPWAQGINEIFVSSESLSCLNVWIRNDLRCN